MIIPPELRETIDSDPLIASGTPCFKGTRVPLETFIDPIEAGYSVNRFLKGSSSVNREQAATVLGWLREQGPTFFDLEVASKIRTVKVQRKYCARNNFLNTIPKADRLYRN